MIKEVHIFENGNVMVFDDNGEQISVYQTSFKALPTERHRVIKDAPKSAVFKKSVFGGQSNEVTREAFSKLLDIEPEWCKQEGSIDAAR